jgi:hypothetical protein
MNEIFNNINKESFEGIIDSLEFMKKESIISDYSFNVFNDGIEIKVIPIRVLEHINVNFIVTPSGCEFK